MLVVLVSFICFYMPFFMYAPGLLHCNLEVILGLVVIAIAMFNALVMF